MPLASERLILEIAARCTASELEVVEEVLATVRATGIQLSVRDFDTGYFPVAFLPRVACGWTEAAPRRAQMLGAARYYHCTTRTTRG